MLHIANMILGKMSNVVFSSDVNKPIWAVINEVTDDCQLGPLCWFSSIENFPSGKKRNSVDFSNSFAGLKKRKGIRTN